MNREQAAHIVGLLSDRHIDAAACYAPPAMSGTPERSIAINMRHVRKPILIAAVFVLILALGVTAYAVDLAGFRQTVQVWLDAERQEAELWDTDQEGTYVLIIPNGEKIIVSGGKGTEDGTTVPMSAGEILEQWENNFEIQIYTQQGADRTPGTVQERALAGESALADRHGGHRCLL